MDMCTLTRDSLTSTVKYRSTHRSVLLWRRWEDSCGANNNIAAADGTSILFGFECDCGCMNEPGERVPSSPPK